MTEIAALVSLARNDKGIPRGIAALVSLARNDKGIPQGIAALVSLARNDNARPSLRGHLCPWQSHTWNKYGFCIFLMAEIAALRSQ